MKKNLYVFAMLFICSIVVLFTAGCVKHYHYYDTNKAPVTQTEEAATTTPAAQVDTVNVGIAPINVNGDDYAILVSDEDVPRTAVLPVTTDEVTVTDLTSQEDLSERYKNIYFEDSLKDDRKGDKVAGKVTWNGFEWVRQVVAYNGYPKPDYNHPVWEYTRNLKLPTTPCSCRPYTSNPGYKLFSR